MTPGRQCTMFLVNGRSEHAHLRRPLVDDDDRGEHSREKGAVMTWAGFMIIVAVLAFPPVVATVVFAWHAIRQTEPGPAGDLLLQLLRIVLLAECQDVARDDRTVRPRRSARPGKTGK